MLRLSGNRRANPISSRSFLVDPTVRVTTPSGVTLPKNVLETVHWIHPVRAVISSVRMYAEQILMFMCERYSFLWPCIRSFISTDQHDIPLRTGRNAWMHGALSHVMYAALSYKSQTGQPSLADCDTINSEHHLFISSGPHHTGSDLI